MKKTIILLFFAGLMSMTSAGAATIDNIVQDEQGIVTITGTAEKPGKFTIQMLEPNTDVQDITDENAEEKVHAIGEFDVGNSGNFEKEVTMKKTAVDKGVYTVRINSGTEQAEKTFVYYNTDILNSEFDKFKQAKSADEAYNIVSSNSNEDRFGINSENYKKLSAASKKKIAASVHENIKSIEILKDLQNEYERLSIAECISNGIEAIEKLDKYAQSLGIAEDKRYQSYSEMPESQKQQVVLKLKGADLFVPEKAKEQFAQAVFLTQLKNAEGISQTKKYILENEDLFADGALAKYKAVSDTGKADKAVTGVDFKTVANVAEAINGALTASSGNGGGSSSGASSGSSGNNKSSVMPGISVSPIVSDNQKISFNDLEQAEWARTSIEYLAAKKVVNGRDNGDFDPNANVTREEFVKMLVLAFEIDTNNKTADFLDIPSEHWSYPYVAAGYEAGLINGVEDKVFGAGQTITRQDMAVLVYRFINYNEAILPTGTITEFTDKGVISDYAVEAIAALRAADVVSGMPGGDFKPLDPCTRAQATKIIYTALTRTGRIWE